MFFLNMISTTIEFIEKFKKDHPKERGKVLDVGSFDVNGNVRHLFSDFKEYVGVDMREGKNVDVVVNGHDLIKKFGKESFDVVMCFDTLEHDDKFWLTVENMRGVLKKGGWLLLGAPSLNHPRHNHPYDYYRFFDKAFEVFLGGFVDVGITEECYNTSSSDKPDQIFGIGKKP